MTASFAAHAQEDAAATCTGLPDYASLKRTLSDARHADNGGLNLDMWGAIVDRSGVVCAVVYTGEAVGDQWPGSRAIAAQKANTANAFSLDKLAISTANLYSATQPGGSLFGLQDSNPVDANVAYLGDADEYGSEADPMLGGRIGGVNVFGGGLALYDEHGKIIGALGVSGDTSCSDHAIAWRTRSALALDYVGNGVSAEKNDAIIYDIKDGKSAGGYGHPTCGANDVSVAAGLPKTRKAQ
jgi:uncharacterized protein GlcG (DUF336 family)